MSTEPVAATEAAPLLPEAVSPEEAGYLRAREAFLTHTPSRWSGVVLLVSMVLFALTAASGSSWKNVALLTLVLFLHETGHWAGMRAFGFRDVKMFFIPFFGAAVSGRSMGAESWKEALVILLGPLPGLFIGVVLAVAGLAGSAPALSKAAMMFLLLNGFNLLPVVPLDGGRLFQLVLFSRNRYLELGFSVFAGLAMLALSIPLGWVLGAVGAFTLFTLPFQSRRLREVHALRSTGLDFPAEPAAIPEPALRALYAASAAISSTGEHEATPHLQRARAMHNLHERVRQQPPSWGASVVLATLWGFGLVVLIAGLIAAAAALPSAQHP